jgi:hypothetical protein
MTDAPNETPQVESSPVEPVNTVAIEPPSPSLFAVMAGLLTAPGETFRRIAGKGGWACLAPFLLLLVLGALGGVLFTHKVNMEDFIREQIRQGPRGGDMSEAQLEQGVQVGAKWAKAMSYIGFVTIIIKYLIVAAVLWLVVLAFGDSLKFPDSLRVVCWSQLPNILVALLAIVVLFVKDPTTIDPQNMVMTNLGAILGKETLGKAGYALLSDLDVFTFWLLWLYTRGLSAFAKAGVGKMAAIVFGLYGVLVLGHVAFAAIF